MVAGRATDDEFEFLVNLLASDGAELDPRTPGADVTGSRGGDGFGIQRGLDGKLDLGQVRAYYERRNTGEGKEKGKGVGVGSDADGPGPPTNYFRNRSGLCLLCVFGRLGVPWQAASSAPARVPERSASFSAWDSGGLIHPST